MSMGTMLYHKTRKPPKATLALVKNSQCQPEEMCIDNTEASLNSNNMITVMDGRTLNMLQTFLSKVILKNTSKNLNTYLEDVTESLLSWKLVNKGRINHLPAFPLGTVNQVNQIDTEGNSLSTEGTQVIKREMIEQEYHDFVNSYWK